MKAEWETGEKVDEADHRDGRSLHRTDGYTAALKTATTEKADGGNAQRKGWGDSQCGTPEAAPGRRGRGGGRSCCGRGGGQGGPAGPHFQPPGRASPSHPGRAPVTQPAVCGISSQSPGPGRSLSLEPTPLFTERPPQGAPPRLPRPPPACPPLTAAGGASPRAWPAARPAAAAAAPPAPRPPWLCAAAHPPRLRGRARRCQSTAERSSAWRQRRLTAQPAPPRAAEGRWRGRRLSPRPHIFSAPLRAVVHGAVQTSGPGTCLFPAAAGCVRPVTPHARFLHRDAVRRKRGN